MTFWPSHLSTNIGEVEPCRSPRPIPDPFPGSPHDAVPPVSGAGPDDRLTHGQIEEIGATARRLAERLLGEQSENDWMPDAIDDKYSADAVEDSLRKHLQRDIRLSYNAFREEQRRRRQQAPDHAATWPEDA